MNRMAWALNTAWMLKCRRTAAEFARASHRVANSQEQLLLGMLRANRDTEFGARYRLGSIQSAQEFQERVPLADFDDFASSVGRIAGGEANVLTREPVRLLEPTSGTSGGERLIPYTRGMQRQFQRGVEAWIYDLFSRRPAVRRGRAYWSISPAFTDTRRSSGGIPIGFDDDAAYLGRVEQFALRRLLVAPSGWARLADVETFRYCTLLSLLAAEDLSLISVWSPTFLTTLLAPIEEWRERLCQDLREGSITPPGSWDNAKQRANGARRAADHRRADIVKSSLGAGGPLGDRLRAVWPHLALISCWADAGAAQFVPQLQELFPGVEIQPKGLLATEGFVSFPLVEAPGSALSIGSHFFEFEEIDRDRCALAHELSLGSRYRVVLTTAGGLYRYRLRDEIEVVGFHHECPLIRFLGRSDLTSDLVGEKLSEPHVRSVVERLTAAHQLVIKFAMLVPLVEGRPRYRLYLQATGLDVDTPNSAAVRVELERGLSENLYYRQAVALGQLDPVEIAVLPPDGESAWLLYERRRMQQGAKCGAVKPVFLDQRTDWPDVFEVLESRAAPVRSIPD